MTTILLARHGESDWNREGRWQGHADRPLTEHGRLQARALAERLRGAPLPVIYASDLSRAAQTAQIVGEILKLQVVELPGLREVDVGSWSGLTLPETEERFPEGVARWRRGGTGWDGGESYAAMTRRVVETIRTLALSHDGGQLLVVCHGGCIRALHARALRLSLATYRRSYPPVANAQLSAIRLAEGAFVPCELPSCWNGTAQIA